MNMNITILTLSIKKLMNKKKFIYSPPNWDRKIKNEEGNRDTETQKSNSH